MQKWRKALYVLAIVLGLLILSIPRIGSLFPTSPEADGAFDKALNLYRLDDADENWDYYIVWFHIEYVTNESEYNIHLSHIRVNVEAWQNLCPTTKPDVLTTFRSPVPGFSISMGSKGYQPGTGVSLNLQISAGAIGCSESNYTDEEGHHVAVYTWTVDGFTNPIAEDRIDFLLGFRVQDGMGIHATGTLHTVTWIDSSSLLPRYVRDDTIESVAVTDSP